MSAICITSARWAAFFEVTLTSASSRSTRASSLRSLTLRTSITLYSCLVTCSTAERAPSTTIVRRMMPGSLVRPMLRLSMAKLRWRNRLITRLRVAGPSSTVATSVCWLIGRSHPSRWARPRRAAARGPAPGRGYPAGPRRGPCRPAPTGTRPRCGRRGTRRWLARGKP